MRNKKNPFEAFETSREAHPLKEYNGKAWGIEADPTLPPDNALLRWIPGRRRLVFVFSIIAIGGLVFLGRLFDLQVVRGTNLRITAEENRIRITPIKASRGIFYDTHGKLLVRNVPNLTLEVIPGDLPGDDDLPALSEKIASILHEPNDALLTELRTKQTRSFQAMILRDHLPYETALQLRLVDQELPGIRVEISATREYLGGPAFSNILGYTGNISTEELASSDPAQKYRMTDEVGKGGIERSYESTLRGVDGQEQVEVNALGKEQRVVATEAPMLGEDLWLSVDASLQRAAQQTLDDTVNRLKVSGAAAVVFDVRNGHILAMVSSPTYDNNIFVNGEYKTKYQPLADDVRKPLFNRAIAGQYPPGSTIKPLLASAGLQEGVIDGHTTVNSTGGITIGQWAFPDWKLGGHGFTDVRKALAWSVNTFFYLLGGGLGDLQGLGVDRMTNYLRLFGFDERSGIDIPGESSGFLPSKAWKENTKNESWYVGDTYHLAIGQGDVLATPLQMARATAAIANGGTLYHPQLVTSVVKNGVHSKRVPSVERKGFISEKNLVIVREGMRQAVTDGSATQVQVGISLPVAAKTGTAQFGTEKNTHAWFTAFAPYESPEISVAVVVEGGGEGTRSALPIARDILRAFFAQ